MNLSLFHRATLTCLVCVAPSVAQAQYCGEAFNCTITRPRPVVSTQLRAQQVMTYRDVNETQICHKQVVENVPVTSCQNVTVDEGGYQMVWVPKPVTRQVSHTTVHQQVKTVAVPVQTTRRIPQMSTQLVPVQTVQYVNETVPVGVMAAAPTCNTCGGGGMIGMQPVAPQLGIAPIPYQPAPYTSASTAIPTMPAITVPTYQSANSSTSGSPSRAAAPAPRSFEETVPARGVPAPRDESALPRKTSMFQGVPSAASAWQRQTAYAR